MSTEKLIVEAFERQADRAPDGHRVLAALRAAPVRPTRKLPRTGVFALATAAAVAAVSVPFIVSGNREATPAAPPAPWANNPRPPGATPIDYRPAWLPEGFTEQRRGLGESPGEWNRYWRRDAPMSCGGRPEVVTMSGGPMGPFPAADSYKPVDINGHPGQIALGSAAEGRDHEASVVWWPAPGTQLSVHVVRVKSASEVALTIARSVTPDDQMSVSAPFTFGWLPGGVRPGSSDVGNLCGELAAHHTAPGPGKGLTVQLVDHEVEASAGSPEPVTVRGRQGTYNRGELVVAVEDGTWLRILGPADKDALVRMADSLVINPEATRPQPWFGTR